MWRHVLLLLLCAWARARVDPSDHLGKLSKVSLTQKGYIQFLRYLTDVPPIKDFTFCIWLRSNNLTYSHPLLSYSMHESDRYIRAWVNEGGKRINLRLRELEVLNTRVPVSEHHWQHVCVSWASARAIWHLFVGGRLHAHGHAEQARGLTLPGGGDIVVGQEYTDFDKGLDDGIEGDIFGFNMVLEAVVPPPSSRRRHSDGHTVLSNAIFVRKRIRTGRENMNETSTRVKRQLSYASFQMGPFQPRFVMVPPRRATHLASKTLGLQLVELSYDCARSRGAPIPSDRALVSWTKTPVRVFGGAVIKQVDPFCHNAF